MSLESLYNHLNVTAKAHFNDKASSITIDEFNKLLPKMKRDYPNSEEAAEMQPVVGAITYGDLSLLVGKMKDIENEHYALEIAEFNSGVRPERYDGW